MLVVLTHSHNNRWNLLHRGWYGHPHPERLHWTAPQCTLQQTSSIHFVGSHLHNSSGNRESSITKAEQKILHVSNTSIG